MRFWTLVRDRHEYSVIAGRLLLNGNIYNCLIWPTDIKEELINVFLPVDVCSAHRDWVKKLIVITRNVLSSVITIYYIRMTKVGCLQLNTYSLLCVLVTDKNICIVFNAARSCQPIILAILEQDPFHSKSFHCNSI